MGRARPAPSPSHPTIVALRILRITAFATTLAYLFHRSHQASVVRGDEDVPGMLWAVGVLSALFLIRAFLSEVMPDGPRIVQRDLLWGLSLGGIATILFRNLVGY
jgi:hypothetical protein